MDDNNPLQRLIVDAEALDKEKLASLITGNLGISQAGDVIILPGFNSLTTKSKILSILLAKKAAKVMGLIDTETTGSKEITQKTGLPEGTVGRELAELKNARLIGNEGGYFIPDYAIHQISIDTTTKSSNSSSKRPSRKINRATSQNPTDTNKSDKIEKLLQIPQESIAAELIELLLKPGLTLERSLAVLKIARDNNINDLTPAEIEVFLKDKIRAGAIWRTNISLYLGKKGTRYVDRFPDPTGSGFTYRIMVPGEKLLEETLKKHGENQVPTTPVEESPKTDEKEA